MLRVALRLTIMSMIALSASSVIAATSDLERGMEIYFERCVGCHGEEGMGLGAGAERLLPPPRDFTAGTYKIMTTAFDDFVPQDDDVFRMISQGMPGTAMPGWSDVLSEQEMRDLVVFVKSFAGYDEETPGAPVDYGEQVPSSEESIARGRELFVEDDRCTECHGLEGKGDAGKRLLGDVGERTWPRNLTKPWTFRGGSDARAIVTRISTGIPGTQMPSFDDPDNAKSLAIEDRWHVANYVRSIATDHVVNPRETVIRAAQLDPIPSSPDDAAWQEVQASTFYLVPQIVAQERHFTPSNDTVTVRAAYSNEVLALLLEWDDRTKSLPGDETAEKIGGGAISQDGVAVQLPIHRVEGMEKPYFGMGDESSPVSIWHWRSGTAAAPQSVAEMIARGSDAIEHRNTTQVQARGTYEAGTWKVVFTRPLTDLEPQTDPYLAEGAFLPIGFAAWDGSAAEDGSRHTMTTWYWLMLEPQTGARPYIGAMIALLLVLGGQYWWVRSARRAA